MFRVVERAMGVGMVERAESNKSEWASHCEAAAKAWEESAKSSQAKAVPPKGSQVDASSRLGWQAAERDFLEGKHWRELGMSPLATAIFEHDLSESQRDFIFNCSSAGWVATILECGLGWQSKERRDALRCEKLAEYLKSALLWGSKDIAEVFNAEEPFSSAGPSGFGRLAKKMRSGRLATGAGVFAPLGAYAAGIASHSAGLVGSSPAFTALVAVAGVALGAGMCAMTFKRTPDVAAAGRLLAAFEPRVGLKAAKAFMRGDAFELMDFKGPREPRDALGQSIDAMMACGSKDWILGSEYNSDEELAACAPLFAALEAREIAAGLSVGQSRSKRSKSI
jgi:hypothetical protein